MDFFSNNQGKVYVQTGFTSTARIGVGGFCTRRGGCRPLNSFVRNKTLSSCTFIVGGGCPLNTGFTV